METAFVLIVIASWLYMFIFRRWAYHKQQIQERLKSFQVRDCICAVESDRAVVYEKIADLMRISKCVHRSAPLEDALTAFDAEVREKMPGAFKMLFGWTTLSYGQYVFLGFTIVAPSTADFSTRLQWGNQQTEVINEDIAELIFIITLWPAAFFITEVLAGKWLHWTGAWQFCIFVAVDFIVGIPAISAYYGIIGLATSSNPNSTWILLAICVACCTSTFLAVCLHRRHLANRMAPVRSSEHVHVMNSALSALSVKTVSTGNLSAPKLSDGGLGEQEGHWKSDETSGELDVTRCFV
eukprot:CAMPEP_0206531712 /NCGR_PEP_ID=MMETSP0325_2-20121206/3925_1 /ASSEMBLY_ACC=CAM_ASM_000347 /TAXON_ID=2866 /ORGANISM="Crypthecodinium cohnii, Strain Seligo" /LENGTH=295 /DNA_ID=CAMNT_0054028001 /DNA_START=172 /DNA_END=1059 /DNA_ORIENTATION=+